MTIDRLPGHILLTIDPSLFWILAISSTALIILLIALAIRAPIKTITYGYHIGVERGRHVAPADATIRIDDLLVRVNRRDAEYAQLLDRYNQLVEDDAAIRGNARAMLQQARRDANRLIDNMVTKHVTIDEMVAKKKSA